MGGKTNTIARRATLDVPAHDSSPAASFGRGALMNVLLGSATLSVMDQAVISATRFAVCVLIGRLCGQDQLGIYYLAASILVFAQGVQDQIIRAPFAVYCPQRKGRVLRIYTGSLLVHQLILSAICVLAILGCSATVMLRGTSPELGTSLFVLAVAAMPWLCREFVRGISFGHLHLRSVLLVDVCVALLQLIGLGLLVLAGWFTVPSALLVLGAACALVCSAWFWLKRRTLRIEQPSVPADWRRNWEFSRWALASHVLGSTAPIIVTWVLAATNGAAATGQYAACMTIVGLAYVVVGGLTNLAVPRATRAFVEQGAHGVRRAMFTTAIMLALPAAAFVVLAYFAADSLALLLYGDKFTDCGPIVTLLGLWMLANNFGVAAGSSLWAIGQPRANLPADVVAFVLTGTLSWLGAVLFGVTGAACAMSFGILAGSVIRWMTATRQIAAL